MLLSIDKGFKLVYQLSHEIEQDPTYMELIQKVTLDPNKPNIGLKGSLGLYGSDIWWDNIKNGKMKSSIIKGVIIRCYKAGQDGVGTINSFELILSNGKLWDESIYVNNKSDISLFKVGHEVIIFYAHDERKPLDDERREKVYSNTVIEMAVSKEII